MIDSLLGMSRASARRPAVWALAHLVPTVVLGLGIFRLEVRTDGASIHPRDHPMVLATAADRETFAENEQVILLVGSREEGPPVASVEGFVTLSRLHRELGEIPGVEAQRVRSLANLVEPPRNGLLRPFQSLLEPVPADPRALDDRLQRIWSHPLAAGLFLSADGRAAAIYVPLEETESSDRGAFLTRLETWVQDRSAGPFELLLTGPVVAEARLGQAVLEDLRVLVPLVVLVMAVWLAVVFRSPGGVLVPLLQVVVVLVWTLGCMGWLGVPITLVTTLLPVVLMTVTVLDEIHLLARLRDRLGVEKGAAGPAAVLALAEIARPVVATSVTSALAFLSFASASLPPVRHFGIFAALGTLIAMGLTFSLAPAWIALLPRSWVPTRSVVPAPKLSRLDAWLVGRRRWASVAALVVCVAAAPGVLRLRVQDAWVDNFAPGSSIVRADYLFNQKLWGSYRLDVVCRVQETAASDPPTPGQVPLERSGYFLSPEGIRRIEKIRTLGRNSPPVGGVVTHLLPFELIARSQGYVRPLSTLTPLKLSSLARRVDLVAERIDLDQFLTPEGDAVRVRMLVRDPDFRSGRALEERLRAGISDQTAGSGVSCRLSGELPVAQAVVGSVVSNQLRSMGLTVLAVGALLWVFTRSFHLVVVLLLPVLAAAWTVFGGMGYASLPLGVATSMFAALAIGVGVDFALHFRHAYHQHQNDGDPDGALVDAFATAGLALRLNALVLVAGFLVLTRSALLPNRSLGWLLAAVILSAYGMTVSLLPHLLTRLDRGSGKGPEATDLRGNCRGPEDDT